MKHYSEAAVERMMKVQAVILRAMGGKLQWWQAAEILGVSDRTMRRWRWRYQQHGYDGLYDRRKGKPSPKRVPLETVESVLQLYRQEYADHNVRHFHQKLGSEYGMGLSYSWVKAALQGAGLVTRAPIRQRHRQRRPRRPLPGRMLQWASMVSRGTLVRAAHGTGRRDQPGLLRPTGGRRINANRDGGLAGSDRAAGV